MVTASTQAKVKQNDRIAEVFIDNMVKHFQCTSLEKIQEMVTKIKKHNFMY